MTINLFRNVHPGVKLITLATAIRWTSWALVTPILPLFLFSFTETFGGTGIFNSVYNVIFILSLPIIGHIANRISAKYLILTGLLIYPLISVSYYLAGVLGVVWFAVLAKALNGFNYALDSTGRFTYFRRHMPQNSGKAFGYFETVTSIWYVAAVLVGYFIIDRIPINYLFLLIIPTVVIAFAIVFAVSKDKKDATGKNWAKYVSLKSFTSAIKEFRLWGVKLKKMALISFASSLVFTITDFFMPLKIYFQEDNLHSVLLFAGISSLPGIFGFKISKFVEESGSKVLYRALTIAAIALLMFVFTENFLIQLILIFIINLCAVAVSIFIDNRSTLLGDKRRYGTISSLFSEIGACSGILGPILFGFLIDFTSMNATIAVGAAMLFVISLLSSQGILLNVFRKTRE